MELMKISTYGHIGTRLAPPVCSQTSGRIINLPLHDVTNWNSGDDLVKGDEVLGCFALVQHHPPLGFDPKCTFFPTPRPTYSKTDVVVTSVDSNPTVTLIPARWVKGEVTVVMEHPEKQSSETEVRSFCVTFETCNSREDDHGKRRVK